MELEYELKTIENAKGEGYGQRYVSLQQAEPLNAGQVEQEIESATSLTAADVRGVLTVLRDMIVRDLSQGRRVHLDGIGYLSLSAGLALAGDDDRKVTGKDIYLRGVNFRPEDKLVSTIRGNVSFRCSKRSSKSAAYTSDELWGKVKAYLSTHRFITVNVMREQFALSRRKASEGLTAMVAAGRLVKEGTPRHPVYFLA